MEGLATNMDALKLAERLQGIRAQEYWLHLEAEGPLEKYPAKQHARRVRERLDVTEGLIYLPGASAKSNEDSDMPAPFRQRRYFYYLTGCDEADCQLAYDVKRDVLTLFIPRVNPARVIWYGRGSTPAEAMDKYDIDEVFYEDQVESWIHDWFLHYRYDGSQQLYILHKTQMPPLRFPWPVDATSLQPAMDQCRMVKDDHEINLIRKANDISSKAHKQVLANITRFHNEAQVEGLFLDVCVSHQAKQQAYDPIAASGPNAGTLHYDANNEDFQDRQLMCLDAGCEFELYASDITRTFPLSETWPSKEAEDIYKLVERMQEACISKLAPGVRYLDLHVLAHHIAIDGLLKLGLLHNGTREEIYKAGTSKAFFPHGLGHHVGLEVHDVGQRELMAFNKYSRYEQVPSLYPEDFHLPVYDDNLCMSPTDPQSPHLEEGMVVTVEPGIYFSAYAFKNFYLTSPVHAKYINTEVLARYFPVGGVRIEDDILITSKGYENLTTAPKGEEMFAIIRGEAAESGSEPRGLRANPVEERFRRAPGIPRRVAEPLLRSISRAATEPIHGGPRESSEDSRALQDHWLFQATQDSARATGSANEKKSRSVRDGVDNAIGRASLCGNQSAGAEHIFMGWETESRKSIASPYEVDMKARARKCEQCIVLSEAIDRLRKSLSQSTKAPTKTYPNLETNGIESPGNDWHLPAAQSKAISSARPKEMGMRPMSTLPVSSLAERTPVPGYSIPPPASGIHRYRSSGTCSEENENITALPQSKPQRRSVTFNDRSSARAETAEKTHNTTQRPAREHGWRPVNAPTQTSFPPTSPPQTRSSTTEQATKRSPDAQLRRSFAAAADLEYAHLRALSAAAPRPAPRPSLPNLRPAPWTGRTRIEDPMATVAPRYAAARLSAQDQSQSQSQSQDSRRVPGTGGASRAPGENAQIPASQRASAYDGTRRTVAPTTTTGLAAARREESRYAADGALPSEQQRQRLERLERELRASYGRVRHGGEELQGVDYTN